MTGISDINIVVQQGDSAKEVQNVRHATHDYNQVVSARQKEKETQERTTVLESEDSKETKLNNDAQERRKRRRKKRRRHGKDVSKSQPHPDAGNFIDTVA